MSPAQVARLRPGADPLAARRSRAPGTSVIGDALPRPRVAWTQPRARSAPGNAADIPSHSSGLLATPNQILDAKELASCLQSPPTAAATFSTIRPLASLPSEGEAAVDAEAAAAGAWLPSLTKEGSHSLFESCTVPELTPLVWDAGCSCKELTLSDGGRVVTRTGSSRGLYGVIVNKADVDSFKVRVRHLSTAGCISVGYACLDKTLENREVVCYDGWFIRCANGRFWTAFGDAGATCCGALRVNDLIEVILDRTSSRISFLLNNEERIGVDFRSMSYSMVKLFPCAQLGGQNAAVELA